MSLLGIDVGTIGCKVALFSLQGEMLASAYREYNARSPQPGWAELDAAAIWEEIKVAIRSVISSCPGAEVQALSISSLGEAVVPVSAERCILGPSLLNYDCRGEEFLPELAGRLPNKRLFEINGNILGNHYSGIAALKRGHEHHFSTSFWVANERRPRWTGGCQRGGGMRKLNNSVVVQI